MNGGRAAKRVLDVVLASTVLLVLSPLLVTVVLLIWILEGRPIFYVSKRFVSPFRSIPVYKFRTMVLDANDPKYRLRERFMREGYLDIPRTCEVYTPIGRVLERLQIVEVPQMLNVLFHGMSLIGNRPLPAENVRLLQRQPDWYKRFNSPAGITGIAQVVGKLRLSPEQRLHLEGSYSDLYQRHGILWCDAVIFFETLRVILLSRSVSIERAYNLVGTSEIAQAKATAPRPSHWTEQSFRSLGDPLTVLILGATSSIGKNIARQFAPGNRVILSGRTLWKLAVLAEECRALGAISASTVESDLSQGSKELLGAALQGGVDIIINAACATSRLYDDQISSDAYSACVAADLTQPVELIRSVLVSNGFRPIKVIFISSVLAEMKTPRRSTYGNLKALQEQALQRLTAEHAHLQLMIFRICTSVSADEDSPKVLQIAKAVRMAHDQGKLNASFGTAGRVALMFYHFQPALFGMAIGLSRNWRSAPARPITVQASSQSVDQKSVGVGR